MLKVLALGQSAGLDCGPMVEMIFRYSFGSAVVTFMVFGIFVGNFISPRESSSTHNKFTAAVMKVLAAAFLISLAIAFGALIIRTVQFVSGI